MNRNLLAGGAVMFAAVVVAGPFSASSVHAADRPLIWQPVKNSERSYSVKLGFKLPNELEPEAGFNIGVDANKDGSMNTPLRLWGSMKMKSIQRPAYELDRKIAVDYDGAAETAAVSMNYHEKQIVTSTIDVERNASYVMRYNGLTQDWSGLDANQSVRLSQSSTGTAIVVRATAADTFRIAGAGMGLEQKVGESLTVSGTVDRYSDATSAVTSVNARYSFQW
jgi:hypothetical protein